MQKSNEFVCQIVANQLGVGIDAVELDHELVVDLGLDMLDLVLIALRVEELVGMEIAVDGIIDCITVADLVEFMRAACGEHALASEAPPRPKHARSWRRQRGLLARG